MSSQAPSETKDTNIVSRYVQFCKRHGFNTVSFSLIILLSLIVIGLILFILISNTGATKYESKTIDFGLEDIGELATQAGYYTNVNMITNPNRTIAGIPVPGTSSKAIMTYKGMIRAGVDFDKIQVSIDEENKIVTLTMPPTRVLSNEIDLNSFEKFDESNSIFNPINVENFNQSLLEMKEKAEAQAIENGILEAAKSNAEVLIRSIFSNTNGTEDYSLQFSWINAEVQ
ncbi:MAG: DUF4230 domain-containing protein [Clostridia bacterium]|nr:DUF4230 domain-containing protein [Clostridia bacterium]